MIRLQCWSGDSFSVNNAVPVTIRLCLVAKKSSLEFIFSGGRGGLSLLTLHCFSNFSPFNSSNLHMLMLLGRIDCMF